MTAERRRPSPSDPAPARRRVTLRDIAGVLHLSEATVSRALRNDEQISEETRARIHRVADELDYVPNHAARSLAMSRSMTLGLMIPDVVDPMHGMVVDGFQGAAMARGYAVIVLNGLRDPEQERRGLATLHSRGVDGVALCSIVSDGTQQAGQAAPPIVYIDPEGHPVGSRPGDREPPVVLDTDEGGGMEALVRHLLDTGRRRPSYVNGPDVRSNRTRRLAVVRALERAGVEPRLRDFPLATGPGQYEAIVALVQRERPDALICYDDWAALHLMAALRSAGVRVPDDVAVTGYDDIPFAQIANPSLTTIAQPARELGARAATMLMAAISGAEAPASQRLPVRLVIRESTGAGPQPGEPPA